MVYGVFLFIVGNFTALLEAVGVSSCDRNFSTPHYMVVFLYGCAAYCNETSSIVAKEGFDDD